MEGVFRKDIPAAELRMGAPPGGRGARPEAGPGARTPGEETGLEQASLCRMLQTRGEGLAPQSPCPLHPHPGQAS